MRGDVWNMSNVKMTQPATISELIYYATHPDEIQYDCSFLMNLVPDEREWILSLNREEK